MRTAGSEPKQAGIGELIARRRAEILAGLLACEAVGTPDPDETPEFMPDGVTGCSLR